MTSVNQKQIDKNFSFNSLQRVVYIDDAEINIISSTPGKIQSFSELQEGWDYGYGGPIENSIIREALEIERKLRESGWKTNAAPGTGGEIAVSAMLGNYRIEVVLEADNTKTVIYSVNGKRTAYRPHLPSQSAIELIENYMEQSWNAYASSILKNMMEDPNAGLIQHFVIIAVPYPSSEPGVLNLPEQAYVPIFGNTGLIQGV